jgi:hypothetical protein
VVRTGSSEFWTSARHKSPAVGQWDAFYRLAQETVNGAVSWPDTAAANAVLLVIVATSRGDYVGSDILFILFSSMGEVTILFSRPKRLRLASAFRFFKTSAQSRASDNIESRIRSSRRDREKAAVQEEELRGATDGGGAPRKVVVEAELIDQPR